MKTLDILTELIQEDIDHHGVRPVTTDKLLSMVSVANHRIDRENTNPLPQHLEDNGRKHCANSMHNLTSLVTGSEREIAKKYEKEISKATNDLLNNISNHHYNLAFNQLFYYKDKAIVLEKAFQQSLYKIYSLIDENK